MKANFTFNFKLDKTEVKKVEKQACRLINNLAKFGADVPTEEQLQARMDDKFNPIRNGATMKANLDVDCGDYYVTFIETMNDLMEQDNVVEIVEQVKPLMPAIVQLVKASMKILEDASEKIVEDIDVTSTVNVNGEVKKYDLLEEADITEEAANG